MAKYRVLAMSYINNSIAQEGELVEYDGRPGSNLELVEGDKPDGKTKGRRTGTSPSTPESADAASGLV
jgi:hypothetical protein